MDREVDSSPFWSIVIGLCIAATFISAVAAFVWIVLVVIETIVL